MSTGIEEGSLIWGGLYPVNSVTAAFKADDKEYETIVDLEAGAIYSDYYMFDLNKQIKRQFRPYCKKYGYYGDYDIKNVNLTYLFYSHDVKVNDRNDKTVNSYVAIENMIPITYDQEDEDQRADAYLKNAPISDFNIYYEMENEEIFDPRILRDYLIENKNYISEDSEVSKNYGEYNIISKNQKTVFPENGVAAYDISLTFNDDINDMNYYVCRSSYHKEKEFCFVYTSGIKQGNIDSYTSNEFEEYEFPIAIKDNKLSYYDFDVSNDVTLRFEEKPLYKFKRTCYQNGVAEATENLVPLQNEDGMWYLTLEGREKTYSYSYKFDREQDLEFN